jgi:hypothetical protein
MAYCLPGNHLKHFHGLPPKEKRRGKKKVNQKRRERVQYFHDIALEKKKKRKRKKEKEKKKKKKGN